MTHTPTPYYQEYGEICARINDGTCSEGSVVASCCDEEHADFIVISCNNHEKYESALDKIYEIAFSAHLWGKFAIGKMVSPWEVLEEITNIIDEAIPDNEESE